MGCIIHLLLTTKSPQHSKNQHVRIYNSKLEIPKCRILFLFFYSIFVFILSFRKAKKIKQQNKQWWLEEPAVSRCYKTRSSLTPTHKSQDKYGV
jgi:hypothetical protein